MHPLDSDSRDQILEIIHRGILGARLAARRGDAQAAWVLLDAIHNLPDVLRGDHELDRWLQVDLGAATATGGDAIREIALLAGRLRGGGRSPGGEIGGS